MSKKEKSPKPYSCRECQAGILHPRYITYFTWLDDELITVPDFPAWICDICGRREYDRQAISRLTILLTQNTRHKTPPPRNFPSPHLSGDSASPAVK